MFYLVLYVFCVVIAIAAGLAASGSDVKAMTIPNELVGIIAAAFFAGFGITSISQQSHIFEGFFHHIIAALIVFSATALLYFFKVIGGGDSKLATAFGLWAGLGQLVTFVFYWAIIGAVLGIAALVIRKVKPFHGVKDRRSWIGKLQAGESAVPYAVPITLAALIAMLDSGYFYPQTIAQFVLPLQ